MEDQVSEVRVDRHVTIDNAELQRRQRRLALTTMVVPLLGTIAAIALLFYRPIGVVDILLLAVMYTVTLLGVTVGFHRLFAHAAFQAKPALRVALAILGSMAAQGTPVYWAATHRRHHHFSEGEGDPHSPYLLDGRRLGFWEGLWQFASRLDVFQPHDQHRALRAASDPRQTNRAHQ